MSAEERAPALRGGREAPEARILADERSVPPSSFAEEDEIDLFDLFAALWRSRRLILGLGMGGAACALLYCLLAPATYKAEATVLTMSSVYAGANPEMRNNFRNVYQNRIIVEAILNSASFREKVVEEGDLIPVLLPGRSKRNERRRASDGVSALNEAGRALKKRIRVIAEQNKSDPSLTIEASSHDPRIAARIANLSVTVLEDFLKNKTFSVARKNRVLLEEQAGQTEKELSRLENEMAAFLKEYNIYDLTGQAKATVDVYNATFANLHEKRSSLGMLSKFLPPDNPKMRGLNMEIGLLEEQLVQLREGGTSVALTRETGESEDPEAGPGELQSLIPLDFLPRLKMKYQRLEKQLEIQRKMNEITLEALERAKVEETRDDIYFTVLDRARVPAHPTGPRKSLVTVLGGMAGLFVAVFAALLLEAVRKRRSMKETEAS